MDLREGMATMSMTGELAATPLPGVDPARVEYLHVLPNLRSLVLVIATIDLRGYILLEASLSFLGLGVQPPQPSWGGMVNQGREYLATAWWIAVVPAATLVLTVLAVSLIGDWLRDALDPRLRTR
jgi:peptide/nickel transport system permease protein